MQKEFFFIFSSSSNLKFLNSDDSKIEFFQENKPLFDRKFFRLNDI